MIGTFIQIIHIFSTDIEMEIEIKKSEALVLKRGKVIRCNEIKLSDVKIIKKVN